jgi:uncharacterized membrane protein YgdD (TMEM256/DUF423 family)
MQQNSAKKWMSIGAVLMALAVILGAFTTHLLKERLKASEQIIDLFKTAAFYQIIHALSIIVIAAICSQWQLKVKNVLLLFIFGIIIFSGSLYGLAISKLVDNQWNWLGAITPLGGICLISGWILFTFMLTKHKF